MWVDINLISIFNFNLFLYLVWSTSFSESIEKSRENNTAHLSKVARVHLLSSSPIAFLFTFWSKQAQVNSLPNKLHLVTFSEFVMDSHKQSRALIGQWSLIIIITSHPLRPGAEGGCRRKKWRVAGEERGLYLAPGGTAAPVWGQMYRCLGDSKKFIISSKYRGPARVHRERGCGHFSPVCKRSFYI